MCKICDRLAYQQECRKAGIKPDPERLNLGFVRPCRIIRGLNEQNRARMAIRKQVEIARRMINGQ